MKKRDILDIIVEGSEFGDEGYTNCEEKRIVFKGGIKGQKVRIMIKKIRKNKVEGKILSVLEKAEIETQNTCNHFGICGGCNMLSIPYDTQVSIKENQLQKLFLDYSHNEISNIKVKKPKDNLAYKNKMEFTFGNETKDAPLSLGMHMKNRSNSITTVDSCMIVDEDYRKILKATVSFFQKENLPFYKVIAHQGFLRHLVVRKGKNTGEILVNIVTTSQIPYDFKKFVEELLNINLDGEITGILHTINDSYSDAVICDKLNILYGREYFYDSLLGIKFEISPFSFFQTNTVGAELLYSEILNFLDLGYKDKVLFDLYSGTGTIGILASSKVKKVVGVEIVEEAVTTANQNCELNNVKNAKYFACDVKDILNIVEDKPDVIVLDPPRSGMTPKAIEDVLSFDAPEIIYVSCNPKIFAMELNKFKNAGYKIKKILGVDQFPNTPHVETIALLCKKDIDNYI